MRILKFLLRTRVRVRLRRRSSERALAEDPRGNERERVEPHFDGRRRERKRDLQPRKIQSDDERPGPHLVAVDDESIQLKNRVYTRRCVYYGRFVVGIITTIIPNGVPRGINR